MAYEEPRYEVVHQGDGFEVRLYADRIAAQVEQAAGENFAFGKLFRYISGANQGASKVAMTVPVAQAEKIAMTVPVAQAASGTGRYMQFFLPDSFTLATAPQPTDPAVRLVVVKGGYYAVSRYAGRATDQNADRQSTALLAQLTAAGVTMLSGPIRATYNGPFTPPFMRRNEVMVRIEWP